MGDQVNFQAVVPLAFFTEENVEMTASFLEALEREPGLTEAWLFLNGGTEPWRSQGERLCERSRWTVVHAGGWRFYRMWNDGVKRCSLALVLNNDITWPPGELQTLAQALYDADPDVAITYPRFQPDSRGLAGWCFAIRPEAFADAGDIDERYKTWYGDDELVLKLRAAGYRTQAVDATIWHKVTATMVHRPAYYEERFEDMRLFDSKWPDEREAEAWKSQLAHAETIQMGEQTIVLGP